VDPGVDEQPAHLDGLVGRDASADTQHDTGASGVGGSQFFVHRSDPPRPDG
jgi:hypothetical protein